VHHPVGRYAHLARVKAEELLFLAGQVSVDENGDVVGKGDAGAQTLKAYRNIGTILESAGASFANVVQLTTYVVGRESVQPYLDARTDLFAEIFPDGSYPPNTLLVISGLVDPDMLVEVMAVAALP
jgi:enamine deaminase RidA (YjgF/YER057c/UK114 family)